MTVLSEIRSWLPLFGGPQVSAVPNEGTAAPSHSSLSFPQTPAKPALISFLRHCGCPYAEKTFLQLRSLAKEHKDVTIIAVSHSSAAATEKWLNDVGGRGDVQVVVDESREIYAAWGLGAGGLLSVLNSATLSGVGKLEKEEGIKLRDTESGSRWQTAGSFAVDKQGIVRWVSVASSAEQIGDFAEGLSKIREN